VSQPWILVGEQSSLLTRIATTETVSLCERNERLTAFAELESAIRLYPRNPCYPQFNDFSFPRKKSCCTTVSGSRFA